MFRSTIRDLLWLTVVAVIALGWWFQQIALRREMAAVEHQKWVAAGVARFVP